jgi:uncharacterized protein
MFSEMTWLNPPTSSRITDGEITVCTGHRTDFWRHTFYGFSRDNGHFLYKSVTGDFTAEVTVSGSYKELYDQAGLMIRLGESCWVKCGIEFTDGAMHFSVVVTNDHSDWSQMPVQADNSTIRIRMTRHGEAIRIQYLDQLDNSWKAARLAYIPLTTNIDVGVMCCSPEREGFTASFSDFTIKDPVSRELHQEK